MSHGFPTFLVNPVLSLGFNGLEVFTYIPPWLFLWFYLHMGIFAGGRIATAKCRIRLFPPNVGSDCFR